MNYQKYIDSKEWKATRKAKLKQSPTCECDGGCIAKSEVVHHLHYDTLGNESIDDDLQALCKRCHYKAHHPEQFKSECCTKPGPTPIHRLEPYSEEALKLDEPLPFHNGTDADFQLMIEPEKYTAIASELNTSARIAAILDNLGILMGTGEIEISDTLTEHLSPFVNLVSGKESGWDSYGYEMGYQLKEETVAVLRRFDSEGEEEI